MGADQDRKPLPISRGARVISIALGFIFLLSAAWLFYFPPVRTAITYPAEPRTMLEQKSVTDADPSSVVLALFSAGTIAILYGLNGVAMTRFSAGGFDASSDLVNTVVPEDPKKITPAATPGGQQAPATNAGADNIRHVFQSLLVPLVPLDWKPVMPSLMLFPPKEREMRPGDQITVDRRGFANSASVFYFSHDVMLCFTALLCGADKKLIYYTARQAKNHLALIGFQSTPLIGQLSQIMDEFSETATTEVTENRRREIAAELLRLSRIVGNVLEQTNAQPRP